MPLEEEDHGDGSIHWAADVGGVHLAVISGEGEHYVPEWRASGSTFIGFWVQSLEAETAELRRLGAPLLLDHQPREWGCRTVLADPDGRAVELNQHDHCLASE